MSTLVRGFLSKVLRCSFVLSVLFAATLTRGAANEVPPLRVIQQHYDHQGVLRPGPYSSRGKIRSLYIGKPLSSFVHLMEPTVGAVQSTKRPSFDVVPDLGRFQLDHWTTQDGLPSNKVRSLYQSVDGFLWIGTEKGIVRFDGNRFQSFSPNASRNTKDGNAMGRCFFEDADQTLWVGTNRGLLQWIDGQFRTFPGQETLSDLRLNDLNRRQEGGFWIGTDRGLAVWTGTEVRMMALNNTQETTRVIQCREIGDTLWLGTSQGLWAVDPRQLDIRHQYLQPGIDITVNDQYDRVGVFELFVDQEQMLWASTDIIGIWRINLAHKTLSQVPDGTDRELGSSFPSHARLTQDHQGTIWGAISSYPGGVLQISRNKPQTNYPLFSNPLGQTFDVLNGQTGAIWIASREGLFRLRPIPFTSLSFDGVGRRNGFRSITETPDGTLWFGSRHAFAHWSGNQLGVADAVLAAPSSLTTAMGVTPRGRVWTGHPAGGIVALSSKEQSNRFTSTFAPEFPEMGQLRAALQHEHVGLWLGTENGVFTFDEMSHSIEKLSSSPPEISCLARNEMNELWMGTFEGALHRLTGGENIMICPAGAPTHSTIASLCSAPSQSAWVGTDRGLAWANGTDLLVLPPLDGLPTGRTDGITRDHTDRLWISHEGGIARVAESELLTWIKSPSQLPSITQFDTRDGILSLQRSAGVPPGNTAFTSRDGRIWFSKYSGIIQVDPTRLPQGSPPPQAFVESVEANGKPIPLHEPIRIPAIDSKLLSFQFTTPSLYAPRKVVLQYRMKSISDLWRNADSSRVADYLNLNPGPHTFEVRARNHEGTWSDRPAQVHFTVAPFFWQRGWFWASTLIIVGAITASFVKRRLDHQRVELNQERLESLHRERARIARDIHDHLGARLSETALQAPQLESSRNLAEESLSELRNLIWSVDPEQDTLESYLNFVADFSNRFLGKADIELILDLPVESLGRTLDQRTRLDLAAVFKEALNNIVKHARAQTVTILVTINDKALRLHINDDGVGFPSEERLQARPQQGRGLSNIQSRIEELGGTVRITSASNKGTSIAITVPLS